MLIEFAALFTQRRGFRVLPLFIQNKPHMVSVSPYGYKTIGAYRDANSNARDLSRGSPAI